MIDGRNPAPVDMVNIPSCTGFYTSQVVQDFFHQQYDNINIYLCISSRKPIYPTYVSDLKLPSLASAAQTSQASRHSGAASPKCLESCFRRQLRLWPHHSGKRWRCLSSELNEISCVYMQYFVYFSLSLSLSLSPAPACISDVKIIDGLPLFWGGRMGGAGEEHLGLVI